MSTATSPHTLATGVNPQIGSVLVLGRWLCVIALFFASGDLWPTVQLGFTFRLSQLCVVLALALYLVTTRHIYIRLFPGWQWLYAFSLWLLICLPFSLYLDRSMGYTLWAVLNALTVFTFVQYFRTNAQLIWLVSCYLASYIALAVFGIAQFLLGVAGIDVLVEQWWIEGRLPRINGLSYEPSYFATYILTGWVFSVYLLEKRATIPSRRLQWTGVITTTIALMLSTSRLGWFLMVLWVGLRLGVVSLRAFLRGGVSRRGMVMLSMLPIFAGLTVLAMIPFAAQLVGVFETLAFLVEGIGVADSSDHSSATRLSDLSQTWQAFLNHPVIGTGIGAVPADIAVQRGFGVVTLEDAKEHEGMSVLVELFASTGLIGGVLVLGFVIAVIRRYVNSRPQMPQWRQVLLSGTAWSIAWLLLALQFNQNFLRLYIFTGVAVLMCCLVASDARTYRAVAPRSIDS